jgi:hypothetical protein
MPPFAIETKQLNLFPTPYSTVEKMVIKNGIRFYLNNCAKIPYPITANYLSLYKLFYWSGEHILLKQRESSGQIEREGILYNVIWNQKQKLTRGKILSGNKNKQYAMSFRLANPEYDLPPVVYISELE